MKKMKLTKLSSLPKLWHEFLNLPLIQYLQTKWQFFMLYNMILILLIGCLSLNESKIYQADPVTEKKLEEIEILFMQYEFDKDKMHLQQANSLINQLSDIAKNNKMLEAQLYGLTGRLAYLQNNIKRVNECIKEIEIRNKSEENLFILKSLLEENQELSQKIIQEGIIIANHNLNLKLMQANYFFKTGRFKPAVELYDELFTVLPVIYDKYYMEWRNLAYQLIKNPPKSSNIIPLLLFNEITIDDLLTLLRLETTFFDNYISDPTMTNEMLLTLLKNKKYFNQGEYNKLNLTDKALRKDIAFLLVKILSIKEDDPSLLTRYEVNLDNIVDSSVIKSAVNDIGVDEYFYNAVLILVEREIMELPDGKNFFPDNSMTGLDLYKIIKKL